MNARRVHPPISNRVAVAVVWSLLFLLSFLSITRDTHAVDLPEEQIEWLIDILERTSFDAVGLDNGYGRLVLWEQLNPVEIHINVGKALIADDEIHERVGNTLDQLEHAIDSDATISIVGTRNTFDADILILSTEQIEYLSSDVFRWYLKERLELAESQLELALKKIEEVHYGELNTWFIASFSPTASGDKRLKKFLGIIHPDKIVFNSVFSKMIAIAVGYGNGSFVRWKDGRGLKSVHTHTDSGYFDRADEILLRFLYSSMARNGMRKEMVDRAFRKWISSDYFKLHFEKK